MLVVGRPALGDTEDASGHACGCLSSLSAAPASSIASKGAVLSRRERGAWSQTKVEIGGPRPPFHSARSVGFGNRFGHRAWQQVWPLREATGLATV